MANKILTPIALWKDFDDTLPLEEETIFEARAGGVVLREVFFSGRETGDGRVRVYARYITPSAERFPAILVLFEAGKPIDGQFLMRFVNAGYGVLAMDYCGEREGAHTVYPKAVNYADLIRARDRMTRCEKSARETCWFEWAAAARYAVRFLQSRPEVTSMGAIGLRTGGEVLFKVAPFVDFSCFISVCAAGWLAYQGIDKFGQEGEHRIFDEEHHRFIAGVDSQSYAPFLKCPVLVLSAINDKSYNYDRVFDTFCQIGGGTEKALLFSAHGNGLLGRHTLNDIDLFLDKHLRGRSVFVSKPITVAAAEEDGDLVIRSEFDPEGEIKDFGIFYTENVAAFKTRDWTRVLGKKEDLNGNVGVIPLSLYKGSKQALVFAFANYSNEFSVTSKILELSAAKPYANSGEKSRVIYHEQDGQNGFTYFRKRARTLADCFIEHVGQKERIMPGYGGIKGVDVSSGVISYRVGEPRFRPPEGVSFRFDAYCREDARVNVVFYKDEEEQNGYRCSVAVAGGGKWKSILLDANDFKTEKGVALGSFEGVVSVVFESAEEALVNNVLWI